MYSVCHVFGLWEKTEVTGENPLIYEHNLIQKGPRLGLDPANFLLSCATML